MLKVKLLTIATCAMQATLTAWSAATATNGSASIAASRLIGMSAELAKVKNSDNSTMLRSVSDILIN